MRNSYKMNRHKLFTCSRLRSAYLCVFIFAFALTEIGRYIYRPFVYESGLDDFGMADTMGNHLGAVTLVFFILAVMNATRQEALIVIATVTMGYVGYEFIQQALPGSTFDLKDAIASIIGGTISLLLFLVTYRLVGKWDSM